MHFSHGKGHCGNDSKSQFGKDKMAALEIGIDRMNQRRNGVVHEIQLYDIASKFFKSVMSFN